jgi:hypothetical protein
LFVPFIPGNDCRRVATFSSAYTCKVITFIQCGGTETTDCNIWRYWTLQNYVKVNYRIIKSFCMARMPEELILDNTRFYAFVHVLSEILMITISSYVTQSWINVSRRPWHIISLGAVDPPTTF